MKIYKLPQLADLTPDGSYTLGPEELGATRVSLRYARLRPGSPPDRISAGEADAVVMVLKGDLSAAKGKSSFRVSAGEAFHVNGGSEVILENPAQEEAVYIVTSPCSAVAGAGAAPPARPEKAEKKEEPVEEEYFITSEGPDEP